MSFSLLHAISSFNLLIFNILYICISIRIICQIQFALYLIIVCDINYVIWEKCMVALTLCDKGDAERGQDTEYGQKIEN